MKEVSTVFWAVGGNSMQEAMKNLEQYSKEELIQLAVNTRLNKFLSEYGSFRDDDEDPRGHGKRVPYIGWFWRAVQTRTSRLGTAASLLASWKTMNGKAI